MPSFHVILFLAVAIRHLTTMTGVSEEEDVSALQLLSTSRDGINHCISGRLLGEQKLSLTALELRQRLHVFGIELAGRQYSIPRVAGMILIVVPIDPIGADVNRDSVCRSCPPLSDLLSLVVSARAASVGLRAH